jgi:hypothetical protein
MLAMNSNVSSTLPATVPAAAPEPAKSLLDPATIATALAGIRSDSQREPDTYLRDTVVPHGGE